MTPYASPRSSRLQRAPDRRGGQRARLAAVVTLTIDGKLVDATSVNVSPGGLRLVTDWAVERGQEVSLVFFLDGDLVCARAVVCWSTTTRHGLHTFGVRFTSFEDDAASLLATYCEASVC